MSNTTLTHWMQRTDYLLAIFVVTILTVLIIPIPFFLLDSLIAINLIVSLIILLTVMYVEKPVDFTVFPTLLLITTVFRLAINVASVRLILLYGKNFDGEIIKAFGEFVVGGNFVVGIIIFTIIIAVMFIVITKGAVRISEVAARFTLDSLPGKQMAIDADFNQGIIDRPEAIRRRKELRQEADFYGAMDGASKFVQGDVKVALLIIIVNMVGGLVAGTVVFEMSLKQSFNLFAMLTIGEGLVAQLPALMLATGTGIIVTRAVSDKSLGYEISSQIIVKPEAMMIAGGIIIAMALVPGFPWLILLITGILIFVFGFMMNRVKKKQTAEDSIEQQKQKKAKEPEPDEIEPIDPIGLEIGFNLIPFVDQERGDDLMDRIKKIRRTMAEELGLIVPRIRIRDNLKLKPSDYQIRIRGVEVGRGSLRVKKLLAIPSYDTKDEIEGEETIEPAYKMKAKWISKEDREKAESYGFSVVDPPTIVVTHLSEVIKSNSGDILGLQETQQLLDSLEKKYPALIEEIRKADISLSSIQKYLQALLRENVSIRNLVSILEAILDCYNKTPIFDDQVEFIRLRIAKQLSYQYTDEDGVLRCFILDPEIENILIKNLKMDATGTNYKSDLDPQTHQQIVNRTQEIISRYGIPQQFFVILCSQTVRFFFKKLCERQLSKLVVLSYNEIVPEIQVQQVALITMRDDENYNYHTNEETLNAEVN